MGITKREIASELGVSKRTVANYIEKLGLGNHVSRNGNTDFLDDFAAAAIADAKAKRDAGECERIEGAARAEQHRKDLLDCWGLTSTRKPCRRAAATTPPTSGAISASFRLPKLGGGLPDTEAIPHGITAPPGMCAMTQTAPRSCWRRGRASTTGCPTVVRTMGVRGGKRKNGEGQKPSPFR